MKPDDRGAFEVAQPDTEGREPNDTGFHFFPFFFFALSSLSFCFWAEVFP